MEGWACTKEILIAGLGQYTRAWGTTFDPNAPLSMPDYVREEATVDIPDGVPYLATDKTSYAQGEPIMVTAYGAGFDWVGIVKKGETEALRWWHLAPVGIHVKAWSGKAFDATRLPANGTHSGPLTPGAYTIVLLKDNKTIADGEFVATVDITVTSDTYEFKAPSSDPVIHVNFDGKAEDSCGNATVTPTGNVTYTEGYKGQGAIVGKTNYLSIPGYNPGNESFTIAVWVKVNEITGDPALFATKDWTHGKKVGFAFAINGTSNLHANIGDGAEHRIDIKPTLPNGTLNTWVHYTMVVDRTAHEMKVSINFGEFETVTIPPELVNAPYEGLGALVIGQDATGNYPQGSMTCVVDEFMVFEKALTQAEVTALGASFNS
jgi:arabinan endo-1,5-alpha-L-arabinosidase